MRRAIDQLAITDPTGRILDSFASRARATDRLPSRFARATLRSRVTAVVSRMREPRLALERAVRAERRLVRHSLESRC